MSKHPFTISIFLPDGDANGLRFVEKSNWTGKGIVCPRSRFPDVKARFEFNKPGVYVLLGKTVEDEPNIYIGEGDPVKQRLERHFAEKDFWNTIYLFISKDDNLDKSCIQYLESKLIHLATEAKRCVLENGNTPEEPSLSESKSSDMEIFLEEMLLCYPAIGLNVFETPRENTSLKNILFINSKGIEAKGYESTEGFVVLKGSQVVKEEVASIHRYMSQLRQQLLKQEVLVEDGGHFVLRQNYTFDSPSTAAGVIQGRTANGRIDWKDEDGHTLKEIQMEKLEVN